MTSPGEPTLKELGARKMTTGKIILIATAVLQAISAVRAMFLGDMRDATSMLGVSTLAIVLLASEIKK